jgi:hypothetical protein
MGLDAEGVSHDQRLVRKAQNAPHESESHQSTANANPREKRSLFREIVSRWLSFDWVSISASYDWQARASPSIGEQGTHPLVSD